MRTILHIVLILMVAAACCPSLAMAQRSTTQEIQDIWSAYENLDLAVAEARVEAALEDFERFSPIELGQIHSIFALIHFSRGDEAGTLEQLDFALQVNPNLTLTSRDTPPQVIALFEQLKQEQSASSEPEPELRYLVMQDPRPAAVMRSMILPGWGQMYKKETRKGILLMSAWGATTAGTLVAHYQRKQAEDDYLGAQTLAELNDLYPTFDRWHKVRNNMFVAASAIWIYSYVDALLYAPSPSPVQFHITPYPGNVELNLRVSF